MAMTHPLLVRGVTGLPEVRAGDVLAEAIVEHAEFVDGDVVVVKSKIVSKSEGRVVDIDENDHAARRALIESEAVRVLRRRDQLLITETRHGFVLANAGVDYSNIEAGKACLLPLDPDRSARRIRDGIRGLTGHEIAVIITDTFGRPWRNGVTDVAIGVAGLAAIVDLRGTPDTFGRELVATEVCLADEIAGAAEMVMTKSASVPVAIVRGVDSSYFRESSVKEIVRVYGEDLFR
jgi:coenzyme F420-0:L-glutamate ligase/coenzyme F420-1:gamma-L-glutamate ligase